MKCVIHRKIVKDVNIKVMTNFWCRKEVYLVLYYWYRGTTNGSYTTAIRKQMQMQMPKFGKKGRCT